LFLQALEQGLPDCAGVALGLDRLFMLQQNLPHIEQALSFTIDRA
jgi:lysyl-tRNA synthetase class 2